MPVVMHKNGFKTGISVARIDFTHDDIPYSHGNDVLTPDCQRDQLEPTKRHLLLNLTEIRRANILVIFLVPRVSPIY